MRRISFLLFLILLPIALLAGCTQKSGKLPEKMPGDFAIRFSYWFYEDRPNIYDTYHNSIQKDLVLKGTADASLTVTRETLNEIYQKIRELDIDKITEAVISANLATGNAMVQVTPNIQYDITFTVNGTEYNVTGDMTAWSYKDGNANADHFCRFADFMRVLYQSTEEYKALPEAEGGYD